MGRFSLLLALAAILVPLPSAAQGRDDGENAGRGPDVEIAPYIEAAQVVTAEIEPGDDVFTYTSLAAGVDAGFGTRYSQGSVSLRYERRIAYADDVADTDTLSGIARTSLALGSPHVTFEAGALASRTRVDGGGAATIGNFGRRDDATSQVYAVYGGPSAAAMVGPAEVTASYRLGYTRVEAPDILPSVPGAPTVDLFDESTTHNLGVRAGIAPDRVAPVGIGVGAGWNRQDVSNLDQRLDDRYVRADVTYPVSPNVALVGGVGFEDIEVSGRDALRDADGDPVVGPDGRYVTDDGSARRIAYETDGLIGDVGVLWRPSRRTSLEAHVGRRYASTTYYGTLAYAPDARSSLNVSVYDTITGFGGQIVGALDEVGTDFDVYRNPVTGDLGGCVIGVGSGNNCALARLGSLRSAIFRNRGVAASYGRAMGRTSLGLGAGYDRRSFFGADGSVLAAVDGLVDENFWLAAYATRRLDRRSSLSAGVSASYFDNASSDLGDGLGYSASLAYNRDIIAGLSGTAAVSLDGISREILADYLAASALVGLRYTY
ncbi:preprotein translocase subunit YajC [Aurantiacibacter spongiae]|uniref:Preprotein translocase subunit YajC n=1 Tax=Aurantiacibacter spongiae TaxID=2488860 RepID=A0A3N5CMN2_9SPHN|nr:preprotein translocase subunit YajC [Aurantiacibacter spongiae]RPF70193.1 preprotein translocase subunit YajC [Aurantiacibacter spongiae]